MTKETKTAKRPVEKLRSYPIQAAIWKNESENGTFHSVTFSRSYKDGNDYRDVDSFSGTQLLQLAQLATKAYDRAEELNRVARAKDEEQEETVQEKGA